MKTNTHCALCNSNRTVLRYKLEDYKYYVTDGVFDAIKCLDCGIWHLLKNGQLYDVSPYYSGAYNAYNSNKQIQYRSNKLEKVFPHVASMRLSWMKYFFNSNINSILDIGCGNGKFASALSHLTTNIHGVEMNPEAAAQAESKGMKIHVGTIDSFQTPQEFEMVTLFHVIEHFDQPKEALKKINSLLIKGGHLIIGTPNVDSIERKITGKYWDNWDCPRHLFLFNKSTLRGLLESSGFEITHFLFEENCILNRSLKNKAKAHNKPAWILPRIVINILGKIFAITKTSTSMLVIAKKIT